jgi:hypothetical protein
MTSARAARQSPCGHRASRAHKGSGLALALRIARRVEDGNDIDPFRIRQIDHKVGQPGHGEFSCVVGGIETALSGTVSIV